MGYRDRDINLNENNYVFWHNNCFFPQATQSSAFNAFKKRKKLATNTQAGSDEVDCDEE